MPPFQCDPAGSPGSLAGFWIFGKIAADQHLTINSFYAGRTSPAQRQYFCIDQMLRIHSEGFEDATAYVMARAQHLSIPRSHGHSCRLVDGFILCSQETQDGGKDSVPLEAVAAVQVGEEVSFDVGNDLATRIAGLGWAHPEPWGRWMLGPEAFMILRITGQTKGVQMRLAIVPFLAPGHAQRVEVFANKQRIGEWRFASADANELAFRLPGETSDGQPVVLKFRFPDAISPREVGVSDDSRPFGIGIRSMYVTNQN
jgi:hypothetical protein